ncbi:MAG TPA: alpha/beta fold hydrolase [Jatrophihabitans sp.]|jgi:2,6-dihydroxypseudooxynicotine hydrolase
MNDPGGNSPADAATTATATVIDDRLDSMYRRFTWRILSNSVAPWEFEQLRESIFDYEQWCAAWSSCAAEHVSRGDEAFESGRLRSAGEAYIRAGLFYHWASFMFTHDQQQFSAALANMNAAWERAAPLVSPAMEILSVDFDGTTLHGYLQLPEGIAEPPLVLLVPGADSTKEELFDLAQHILRRGTAVAVFDGPGQGTVSLQMKMRPDYESAIVAILDSLLGRSDIDAERVAVGGVSYGGLFALRAAAVDSRIRAVVSISSWYTPAGRFAEMEPLTQTGQYQYLGEDPASMMESITLAGVLDRVTVPLLQVYGELDAMSPPSNAERIEAEVSGPATTVVYSDGVHILNNVWFKARPMVGDWLAETL